MIQANFAQSVGVSPGTTTMQLGRTIRAWDPYTNIYTLRDAAPVMYSPIDTRAHIRWDLIGLIGGLSLIISMGAGLLAVAFK